MTSPSSGSFGASAAGPPVAATDQPDSGPELRRTVPWASIGGFAALSLGLGAAAGVLWWAVVRLPAYAVAANGTAGVSERGLTEFFAGDAWFCLIGALVGLILGILAWRLFRPLGWPVAVGVAALAFLAALVCWAVGFRLGPGDFVSRLAAARPGDLVPIELTVRSRVALLIWPFAAVVPVLLASSLGRDDEVPGPLFARSPRSRSSTGSS